MMLVLVMQVHVRDERRDDFLELIRDVAYHSEKDEPGCLRFDVLQDNEDQNRFYFYDVYRDEASSKAHRDTPHYDRWVEGSRDMFDEPPTVAWSRNVFPQDEDWR